MVSIVSEAPTPHSPPMATPYSARRMINTVRLGAKPDANSRIEYSRMSTIKVGRRPQRSAARPKMKAPIGRIASVSRIAHVTVEISVWNSAAMSFSTNTSRKKSNASSDHPRKLAATTCFCSLVQPDNAAIAMTNAPTEDEASMFHRIRRPDSARRPSCRPRRVYVIVLFKTKSLPHRGRAVLSTRLLGAYGQEACCLGALPLIAQCAFDRLRPAKADRGVCGAGRQHDDRRHQRDLPARPQIPVQGRPDHDSTLPL